MEKTPKILPHLYKSKGTPIFRDTTALPFANGGIIHFERSEYGSDAREHYDEGGPIYTYSKRPGSFYQRGADGAWMINNSSTGGQYVPINDPTGQRTALLNKNAVVYNAPAQGAPKPVINQAVWNKAQQQGEWDIAKQQTINDARKLSGTQHLYMPDGSLRPQAAQAADWVPQAIIAAPIALEALGAVAATEIPFMGGTTLGTVANVAGGIHGATQVPQRVQDWQDVAAGNMDWKEAALKTGMTGLEIGAGVYEAANAVPNIYKLNPWAGKLDEYNRVVGEDAIIDLQNSGLIRAGERGGVETSMGVRTSAYPSFGKGAPRQAYIDQTIQQGKTPYIISTGRPMSVSTRGRHGKGSTMFPIDESGKYMSGFSADEAKVFEAKPNWLKGYQEVSRRIISDSKSGTESGKAFKTLYPQAQMMPSGYKTYGQTQYVSPVSVNKNFTWNFDDLKNIKSSEGLPEYMNPYLYSKEVMQRRLSPELDNYYNMKEVEKAADKLIKRKIDDRMYYDLNGNIIKTPSDNY